MSIKSQQSFCLVWTVSRKINNVLYSTLLPSEYMLCKAVLLKSETLSGSRDACNLFKYNADTGSGCGSIGRAVTSDTRARGTPFKFSH